MRHLPFTAALLFLLPACQPSPFETTPEKEEPTADATPPGKPPVVDQKNDSSVNKIAVPLQGPFASLEAICGGETPRCRPGNRGSSTQLSVVERTCRVGAGGLVCEDSAPLYEHSCQTPMEEGQPEVCKEAGKKP